MNSAKGGAKALLNIISQHIGALIAVIFWGLSFVSTTSIMQKGHLTPTEAYIYRFTIAYIIIIFISHKRWFCSNWRDELMMVLIGMTSGSLYFIAENTALTMTSPTNVSLLSATSPLVTIFIVGLIYKSDRPGAGIIIGSVIAFVGVVCVILNSAFGSEAYAGMGMRISPAGDCLALSTAVLWAIYSLILKRVNVVYDIMFITRKTFFYGLLTAMPFLLLEPSLSNPLVALSKPVVTVNLVFLALGASIISFALWASTIEKIGAVKANNYMYLQPVVTLIASIATGRDTLTILGIAGLVIVLFGLWFGDYLQARIQTKKDATAERT